MCAQPCNFNRKLFTLQQTELIWYDLLGFSERGSSGINAFSPTCVLRPGSDNSISLWCKLRHTIDISNFWYWFHCLDNCLVWLKFLIFCIKPSHNLFVNDIIPPLLLPKTRQECTQLYMYTFVYFTFIHWDHKSVTIMCLWTRGHVYIELKRLDNDIKTKSISKTCINDETKEKPRKKSTTSVYRTRNGMHNKNSECMERNVPLPKPLGHRAIDISKCYNLYSTSGPDKLVASKQQREFL